jgi:hypothetical protein
MGAISTHRRRRKAGRDLSRPIDDLDAIARTGGACSSTNRHHDQRNGANNQHDVISCAWLGASSGQAPPHRPDGSPTRIWTSREDFVYSLAFDPSDHLIVGTGNRGHIFLIKGEDDFTDLAKASATQVTAFAKAPGGLYASTSNLGKLFLLGSAPEAEGTYESDVFDAKIFFSLRPRRFPAAQSNVDPLRTKRQCRQSPINAGVRGCQ